MRSYAVANWPDPKLRMTTINLVPAIRCREYSDGGAVQTATIKLALVVYLPSWRETGHAPLALQQSWDSFMNALRVHEEGHVQIAKNYAAALRNALQALPIADSCPTWLSASPR